MKRNFSMNKHTFSILLLALFLSSNAKAATVSCDFISGEAYDISTGEWVGSAGYEDIWDIFGEGISLPMENSLLANLDSQEIFRAGETDKGTVYLVGGDMGVEGRLSSIEDGLIIIYSGFCTIGFG
jgi:hypothetical protein